MIDEVDFYLEDLKSKFSKIDPTKYYLSYSGGKDSHLLYWFIKTTKIEGIKTVGINTYMEHPEILDRIKRNSDIILHPAMKPFDIKEKYGSPCFSKFQDDMIYQYQKGSRAKSIMERIYGIDEQGNSWHRYSLNNTARDLLLSGKLHKVSPYCCKWLKKIPARNYEKETGLKAILGVKGTESGLRKTTYTSCFTQDLKFTPLWDLSNELEGKIYSKYQIEIPKIYEKVDRTGCMGCPYGFRCGDTEKELGIVTPQQRRFLWEYFGESYKVLGINPNYTIFDYLGKEEAK